MITSLYSLWRIRQDFLRTLGSRTSWSSIKDRLQIRYADDMVGKKKGKQISERLASFLESPPDDVALYFTDGSASPNPGPSGAGVYRPEGPLPVWRIAISLGHGSNNEAEIYAIGLALRAILSSEGARYNCIFTDIEIGRAHV